MISVYAIFISHFQNLLPQACEILSKDELHRAYQFRFENDQQLYILTHAFLRLLLSQKTGIAPTALVFHNSNTGKPSVDSPIHFNVSHSGEAILIALSSDHPIGVDIEVHRARFDWLSVAEEVFEASEIASIQALDKEEQLACFYDFWAHKEALCKADGRGLSFPFQKYALTMTRQTGNSSLIFQTNTHQNPYTLQKLTIKDGYSAALCGLCPTLLVDLIMLSPRSLAANALHTSFTSS